MRRREFIRLASGSAATWVFAASAQQSAKLPRIEVLWHAGNAEQEATKYKALLMG
jgi:putative tryptophan/tyrosine transport system substrate-binding protein